MCVSARRRQALASRFQWKGRGRLWFSLRATVAEGISAFLNLQGCSQQDRLHLVVLL